MSQITSPINQPTTNVTTPFTPRENHLATLHLGIREFVLQQRKFPIMIYFLEHRKELENIFLSTEITTAFQVAELSLC